MSTIAYKLLTVPEVAEALLTALVGPDAEPEKPKPAPKRKASGKSRSAKKKTQQTSGAARSIEEIGA